MASSVHHSEPAVAGVAHHRGKLLGPGIHAFSVAAFALIVAFLAWGGSPYPYTDDWLLVPYGTGQTPMTLSWLWEQHVDHRIPIPKALWVWSLWVSDMDFRSIMLLNAIGAFLANFFLLRAIAAYRGYLRFGDLVVPLVLLNPSFNIFQWGFYLQFMSSIMLGLLAMALGCLQIARPARGYGIAAAIVIFCLNGVGMNGTVLALTMAPTLFATVAIGRSSMPRWQFLVVQTFCGAAVLVAVYVIATWSPSDAASQTGEAAGLLYRIEALLQAAFTMAMPRAWAHSLLPDNIYLACGLALSVLASFLGMVKVLRFRRPGPVYLLGILFAGWGVIGAIALGRAGFWSPGLEYHYGYFPVLTLMAAWMLVSCEWAFTWAARLVSVALLVVFGTMYINGMHWAVTLAETRAAQLSQIHRDLQTDRPLEEIARDNIALFWWQNTEEGIALMAKKLRLLQDQGYLEEPLASRHEEPFDFRDIALNALRTRPNAAIPTFTATGNDPIIVFNQPLVCPNATYAALEFDLERDEEGYVDIFWNSAPGFTEKKSLARWYPAGRVTAQFAFPIVGQDTYIRLDPMREKGTVILENVRSYCLD